ncbi:hypothetical protein LRD69_08830 [Streptomyces sp. JH14]|uniref:hypothetical protein n=1 Tax=Streptomyces sp. JH14 TaxID=2793630 RepID=UPI0023F68C56|nr:hypothetical protein [Streptomyces sp. JH14]MDF6042266.1 hypothetical protein [Streptomyces sp. JH14]
MSDLLSQCPANSAGILDKNIAGGGTLVGDQVLDRCFSTEQPVRRASSASGPHRALCRLAQHDHGSEPGSCGLLRSVIRTGRRSELI